MISKERLQELINEGATVYSGTRKFLLRNEEEGDKSSFWYKRTVEILDGKLHYTYKDSECSTDLDYLIALEDLYETQKEAEWHLKYHATRTEELNLPTWKEFKDYNENIGVSFVGEDWVVYELSNDIDIYHKPRILLTADGEYFEEWQSTEENYEKACDLCLKLFKGEQE